MWSSLVIVTFLKTQLKSTRSILCVCVCVRACVCVRVCVCVCISTITRKGLNVGTQNINMSFNMIIATQNINMSFNMIIARTSSTLGIVGSM